MEVTDSCFKIIRYKNHRLRAFPGPRLAEGRLNKMRGFYIIQRICEKVVEKWPWLLEHAFDKLKTQKMCEKAVEKCGSWLLRYVPNDLRFRGVCEPWSLQYVPDNLKTQEMCKKAMRNRLATFFFYF